MSCPDAHTRRVVTPSRLMTGETMARVQRQQGLLQADSQAGLPGWRKGRGHAPLKHESREAISGNATPVFRLVRGLSQRPCGFCLRGGQALPGLAGCPAVCGTHPPAHVNAAKLVVPPSGHSPVAHPGEIPWMGAPGGAALPHGTGPGIFGSGATTARLAAREQSSRACAVSARTRRPLLSFGSVTSCLPHLQ